MCNKILTLLCCLIAVASFAQTIEDSISEASAKKHITYLASDNLRGRVNFTREQLKAASYISNEFTACGLIPFPEYSNFYQPCYTKAEEMPPPYLTTDTLVESTLYNVVGILPGKTKPDEAIVFSAHYDHVDIGIDFRTGEIFNGANDDASGTTAVLLLARYFALRNSNERTIIFCLFAGEELGLLGSSAFVRQVKADNIKAVINIEMTGRNNRAGKNKFFITGSAFTDLEEILKKNLAGETISVKKEGEDNSGLFMRSDNYSFAKKGIPAHSIMCSDDKEYCYHKPCDDVNRIDIANMTRVIRGIAKACTSLISGEDTPAWKKK
jgi:Iap family predicted aminopeptidase